MVLSFDTLRSSRTVPATISFENPRAGRIFVTDSTARGKNNNRPYIIPPPKTNHSRKSENPSVGLRSLKRSLALASDS